MLTDQELQSLRNLGNEAEAAADEIVRLRTALLTNHRWHQDTDDYGGYAESELCALNTAALGPNVRCNAGQTAQEG